jgi:hypothetical protein
MCDDSLKSVFRWLVLVHCPGREVKLLGEVDVLLVLCGPTCAVTKSHELNGQNVRSIVELEDSSTLSILLALVAADSDVGFTVVGVETVGEVHTWSVWDGHTETDARWIAVSVYLLAVAADPGNLVLDSEKRSKLVLVDSLGLFEGAEQVLQEIMAVFLGLACSDPARVARSASCSDCVVKSGQVIADTTRRGVVAYEQLSHRAGHASALLWTRFVTFVQEIEELRNRDQAL